jgi:hypothetical protein
MQRWRVRIALLSTICATVFAVVVGMLAATEATAAASPPGRLPDIAHAAARAAALQLPAPRDSRRAATDACAQSVTTNQTDCFDTAGQLATWFTGNQTLRSAGTSAATVKAALVDPLGYGGQQAATSGAGNGGNIGITCLDFNCTSNVTAYYVPASALGYPWCTHAYPYDDYYRWNVAGFSWYFEGTDQTYYHCNRTVVYPGGQEQGGGAKICDIGGQVGGCGWAVAMHSLSWHNR